jgi:hypothetical protein
MLGYLGCNGRSMPCCTSLRADMKSIYLQILMAVLIATLCIIIALFIWGVIKLPILNSIIFKVLVTAFASIGFVFYIYLLRRKRVKRLHIIGFSLIFEALGYWWLNGWIGYVFIILGFGLLILSFVWENGANNRQLS